MADDKRIWAGFGRTASTCALSLGLYDDDPQFSRILLYDETAGSPWRTVEVDVTVVSITGTPAPGLEGSTFVAMGIDGDVFFLGPAVSREKIPDAGAQIGGAGFGSMSQIRYDKTGLLACGYGSQVYLRNEGGDWQRLCDNRDINVGQNSFEGVASTPIGTMAVCGVMDTQRRVITPEEQAILRRIENEGTAQEYLQQYENFRRVLRKKGGSLYFYSGGTWSAVELPNRQPLKDVVAISSSRFVAVGRGGTMVAGSGTDDMEDVSEPGLMELFRTARLHANKVYVLGDTSIFVYDLDFRPIESIALPAELDDPLSIDLVDDVIWYFDHGGLSRYRNGGWEIVEIPADFWR